VEERKKTRRLERKTQNTGDCSRGFKKGWGKSLHLTTLDLEKGGVAVFQEGG